MTLFLSIIIIDFPIIAKGVCKNFRARNFNDMKYYYLALVLFIFISVPSYSQDCEIKIEILPEQFMFGTISEISEEVNKTKVSFNNEVMEVWLPLDGKNYKLRVLNENCQAYCKKQKRVRQLNSGDEKLVKNLIKSREKDIALQIKKCGA